MPFFKETPSSGAIQLQCSFGGIITYCNLALENKPAAQHFLEESLKATMQTTLTNLINDMDSPEISGTDGIEWACPVPSFGDLSTSRVATLGLNPSNQEFEDRAALNFREHPAGFLRCTPLVSSAGRRSTLNAFA
jgi:hypothetical protein